MPKETRVPLGSGRSSSASPYPPATETDPNKNKNKKKNMLIKLVKSVKNMEFTEAKCSICMETPHNGVILQCSDIEKGCQPYMCNTIYPYSNCLKRFINSATSTSCPLCGGEVDNKKWFVIEPVRNFLNSIPRSCSVETCGFTGNYPELENHASLEHPSVRPPSVVDPVREQNWMRLERQRKDRDLIAFCSDFESVVAVNDGHHRQESCNSF